MMFKFCIFSSLGPHTHKGWWSPVVTRLFLKFLRNLNQLFQVFLIISDMDLDPWQLWGAVFWAVPIWSLAAPHNKEKKKIPFFSTNKIKLLSYSNHIKCCPHGATEDPWATDIKLFKIAKILCFLNFYSKSVIQMIWQWGKQITFNLNSTGPIALGLTLLPYHLRSNFRIEIWKA